MRFALVLFAACGATPPASAPPPAPPSPPVTPRSIDAAPVALPAPSCADKEACHHEAEEHEASGDFVAAAKAYGHACGFGDGASCFAQGVTLRGRLTPADETGSHEAFGKACDLHIADGCAQYATDLMTGIGADEDPEAGRTVLRGACKDNSGLACYNLAVSLRDGTFGATKDVSAAYTWFEHGCTLGHGASCNEQAIALYDGSGTKRDTKRATMLADKACGSSSAHCWFRAELYQKEKRYKEARALFDQSCGAGAAVGCHNLGVMLEKGMGGKKDAKRSFDVFEKACSLGISSDCWQEREKECATGFENACRQ